MTTNLSTMAGMYRAGEVYEVTDAIGTHWIRSGMAEWSDIPPAYMQEFYGRLDTTQPNTPHIFLPFCGEFGHLIISHIRQVHHHTAKHKIVCCKPGEQVLFPSATSFFFDWKDPIPDAEKAGTIRVSPYDRPPLQWPLILERFPEAIPVKAGGMTMTQEHIPLYPEKRIPFQPRRRGLKADICLGVRSREFCPERNFPAKSWQIIADAITTHGYTFGVVGKRPTSFDLAGQQWHSGDYDTDASIEAIQNCRLWCGTDTGTSHLAAAIGVPMIIFRADNSTTFIDLMRTFNSPHPLTFLADCWKPQPIIDAIFAGLDSLKREQNTEIKIGVTA